VGRPATVSACSLASHTLSPEREGVARETNQPATVSKVCLLCFPTPPLQACYQSLYLKNSVVSLQPELNLFDPSWPAGGCCCNSSLASILYVHCALLHAVCQVYGGLHAYETLLQKHRCFEGQKCISSSVVRKL
jgi:hypothetical protein